MGFVVKTRYSQKKWQIAGLQVCNPPDGLAQIRSEVDRQLRNLTGIATRRALFQINDSSPKEGFSCNFPELAGCNTFPVPLRQNSIQ